MNYSISYYPDPGISYDIIKMLTVKLTTPNTWDTLLTSLASHTADVEHITKNASFLPSPPPELILFCFFPNNKSNVTFLTSLLEKILFPNFSRYSIQDLLCYINNTDQFIKDLYEYYLVDAYNHSLDIEHSVRSNKNIPDKIKILLLGFSLNPQKYISLLSKTISKYYTTIKEIYITSSNQYPISSLLLDQLVESLDITNIAFPIDKTNCTLCYSLCFTFPRYLLFDLTSSSPFIVTTLQTLTEGSIIFPSISTFSLTKIATALSDQNRISIINYLIDTNIASAQDIVNHLALSRTAVSHHLSILKDAHLLSITKADRQLKYSFNPKALSGFTEAIDKLTKGEQIL